MICPHYHSFCSLKLLAAFHLWRYQSKFSTRKNLLDCRTEHLVPCNENLTVHTVQKLDKGMIRLDNRTQFLSKQLTEILPSGSQSITLFFCEMIFHAFFPFFVQNFARPELPEDLHNQFFPELKAAFLQQYAHGQLYILSCFEMRNFRLYCWQRKLDWLKFLELAYTYGISWDSNSSVSKIICWTFWVKYLLGISACVLSQP